MFYRLALSFRLTLPIIDVACYFGDIFILGGEGTTRRLHRLSMNPDSTCLPARQCKQMIVSESSSYLVHELLRLLYQMPVIRWTCFGNLKEVLKFKFNCLFL